MIEFYTDSRNTNRILQFLILFLVKCFFFFFFFFFSPLLKPGYWFIWQKLGWEGWGGGGDPEGGWPCRVLFDLEMLSPNILTPGLAEL